MNNMEVYRIAKCVYIQDMQGTGARTYGGRWNSKGYAVLYTAGSRSLAALEALAHIPQKNLPDDFCIVVLSIPDGLPIETLSKTKFPKNWQTVMLQPALQKLGNRWLKSGKSAILRVPSVIIPEESNYLINPLHPDANAIKILKSTPFVFDERLKQDKR